MALVIMIIILLTDYDVNAKLNSKIIIITDAVRTLISNIQYSYFREKYQYILFKYAMCNKKTRTIISLKLISRFIP